MINYLENRKILSKGTTKKITSQGGGLLNFLGPLIRAGLPSTLAKNVLLPLGVTPAASASCSSL